MASFINATIDDHKFDALIEVMNDHAVHLKPVLAAVGNLVVKSVKRNFHEGGRPEKWTPSEKPKGKTLIGTGALMRQTNYKVDNDESGVTIMTGKQKYAAILHFGGKTPAHEIWYKNKRALSFMWHGVPAIYGKGCYCTIEDRKSESNSLLRQIKKLIINSCYSTSKANFPDKKNPPRE